MHVYCLLVAQANRISRNHLPSLSSLSITISPFLSVISVSPQHRRSQTTHTLKFEPNNRAHNCWGDFFFSSSFILFFICVHLFGRHSIMDECKPYIDTVIVHQYTCIHEYKANKHISYIEILLQFVAVAALLVHASLSLSASAIIFRDIIRMYCVILCWW